MCLQRNDLHTDTRETIKTKTITSQFTFDVFNFKFGHNMYKDLTTGEH